MNKQKSKKSNKKAIINVKIDGPLKSSITQRQKALTKPETTLKNEAAQHSSNLCTTFPLTRASYKDQERQSKKKIKHAERVKKLLLMDLILKINL